MFRPNVTRVPEDLVVDTDDDVDYFVEVPLAECTETDRLVSLDSRLVYTKNVHGRPGSAWFHELSFEFAVHYMDGSQPTWMTQDRQIVRQ